MSHIVIDARIISSSTGRYVERLLTYLDKIDHTNTYSVLVPSKDINYWKPVSSNFKVLAADFANYSVDEQLGLKRYLDSLNADLVHFCMPQQPVLYRGKRVTTFHDLTLLRTYNSDKNWLIYRFKQAVGKWVFRKVAKSSNHIITPSEFTKNDLIDFAHINNQKISVTYEAGTVSTTNSTKLDIPFKKFILYVGQQADYKNIKRLGDAHQKLLSKYPDLGLVLAGKIDKATQNNRDYFESKKYQNIHFTDFVTDEQLNWLYQNAQAYVFPSLTEGFGLPGLEAMAHNLPLASSNATCLPEIYGDAAIYFDPTDPTDIADTIDQILTNPDLRDRLIKAGQQQFKKYSWEKMAKETLAIYEKVLKG